MRVGFPKRPVRARWTLCVCLSVLLCACGEPPEIDLPRANPEIENPRGLSWLSRQAIDAYLDLNAWWGINSGYVAVFARDGAVAHATTAGYADIEAEQPMAIATRFRIASMTKPVTAVAALLLVEDGRLGLDDPVARYLPAAGALRVATSPDFGPDGSIPTASLSRPLTVRDLLNFRSGMGSENDESDLGRVWGERQFRSGEGSLGDRVDRILTAPLYEQPGEQWRYGRSADVLARVVEVAADEPFDQFLQRRIFTPLGMTSTRYLRPLEERAGMATLYTQDENQDLVRVEGRDPGGLSWTPGGSGLVSTAGDYLRFALMLWNRGSYAGVRILAPETVAMMTHPHVTSGVLRDMGMEGLGWGLGIAVVVDPDATPMTDREGDFWWSGYYGTTFFVSPTTGLTGVVLAQNQPGPFSRRPYAVYLAQAFAFFGL